MSFLGRRFLAFVLLRRSLPFGSSVAYAFPFELPLWTCATCLCPCRNYCSASSNFSFLQAGGCFVRLMIMRGYGPARSPVFGWVRLVDPWSLAKVFRLTGASSIFTRSLFFSPGTGENLPSLPYRFFFPFLEPRAHCFILTNEPQEALVRPATVRSSFLV